MDPFKIVVKFYAQEPVTIGHETFVPVLHGWIQNRAVPEHLLVDVADYSHVQNGPGTLLVAHEANFYLDKLDGFLGFSYSRKQPLNGGSGGNGGNGSSFADNLRYAVAAALEGCRRLEEDPALAGKLTFRTDEVSLKVADRLLAPNTPETFQRLRPDIEQLAEKLWPGATVDIEHYPGELTLFEVRLRSSEPADVATLLERLGAMAA
jgi:hypothetical protein